MTNASLVGMAGLFALGLLHSIGPDHLMAVTALSDRDTSARRVFVTSVQFAAGHAALLLASAFCSVLLGLVPSEGIMRIAETVGGVALIILGAVMFHATIQHGDAHHAENHGSVALGGLLAASGTRTLILAIPAAAAAHEVAVSMLFALSFGLGVVAGMATFGLLLGWGKQRFLVTPRARYVTSLSTSVITLGLGIYWSVAEWI